MTDDNHICKAFKVHGRVQGVGFRWWALHQARALGLSGYVRNNADGTVEIAVAGTAAAVNEMCARLASGPSMARVDRLEELATPDRLTGDFRIDI
jgi:acylphosphatase